MIDDTLIRASQRGDSTAFASLLALVYDIIFRFALKWSGVRSDAEDITQQACIKLAKAIQSFHFRSAFTTWLYTLVVHCAQDWSRSERRHQHDEWSSQHEAGDGGDFETGIDTSAELQRVLGIVEAMGKGFKETVILVHAEGLSHKEAADILSIKESTVSWRLHEVRKQLRECKKGVNP